MKNYGFTLIELLGVIVILALLMILVFPSIINSVKSSSEKTDSLVNDLIANAVQLYMDDYSNEFHSIYGNTYCIPINTLVENNYLKDPIKVDGQDITNTKSVKVSYVDKTNIELVDKNTCHDFIVDLMNMTPVVYDGNNWIIADTSKEWYNYEKQEWANAVILNSDSNKKVGDSITVDGDNPDALAMLVWIPRYEYKIDGAYGKGGTSTESPGEIEVNFISKETKEASEGYRIHPAFNFGGTDISGIWVGKFELSHSDSTKSETSMKCTNESCEEGNNLRILPNVQSLRKNIESSFFYAMRSMSKRGNVFGINSNKTDTHMMKNSEWGAVAYLTQSKYGKYGNEDYNGRDKEVYVNNSSSYYTGRSGGSYGGNTPINGTYTDQTDITTQYVETGFYTYDGYLLEYNTNKKTEKRDMTKIASTTGNIYGIYDMSGGTWEYVMSVFANSDGVKWSGLSGFEGKIGELGNDVNGLEWPNEKYYEVYKASSETNINLATACNSGVCYGHALSETVGWYGDSSYFIVASYPWLRRGGNHDIAYEMSGIFSFDKLQGADGVNGSSRVVFVSVT